MWRADGSRFSAASFSVLSVALLRLAKARFTYRELSQAIGVPQHQLARYVSGRTLPLPETAERIVEGVWKLADPRRALAERLAETGGVLDTSIVLTDPLYLLLSSLYYARVLNSYKPSKIIVPEASGIPLASTLSIVMGLPFIVARRARAGWVCSSWQPSFCIPQGSIARGERVVVVDDIVETGMTLRAVEEIVERCGGRIAAVAALVVVGEEWRRSVRLENVVPLVHLRKPAARREPSL